MLIFFNRPLGRHLSFTVKSVYYGHSKPTGKWPGYTLHGCMIRFLICGAHNSAQLKCVWGRNVWDALTYFWAVGGGGGGGGDMSPSAECSCLLLYVAIWDHSNNSSNLPFTTEENLLCPTCSVQITSTLHDLVPE